MIRQKIRSGLGLFLCCTMLVGVTPGEPVHAANEGQHSVYNTVIPTVPEGLYGYERLNDKDGTEKTYYAVILDAIRRKETRLDISKIGLLSGERTREICQVVLNDNPEFYNVSGFQVEGDSQATKIVTPTYIPDESFNHVKFDQEVQRLVGGVVKGTEYSMAKQIHDQLVKEVQYDDIKATGDLSHTAYGAIVNKKAVCDGYARAYQYLLKKQGIQSYIVTGEVYDSQTQTYVSHAWNLVRLDGKYYHVDVTWDDPVISGDPDAEATKPVYYSYFGLSTSDIHKDHTIIKNDVPIEVCHERKVHPDYVVIDTLTVENVAKAIRPVNKLWGEAKIFYTGTDDFVKWCEQNWEAVVKNSPVSSSTSDKLDAVYKQYAHDCYFSHKADPHTHNPQLIPEKEATCSSFGVKSYYQCTCGNFVDDKCTQQITDFNLWAENDGKIDKKPHKFGDWKITKPVEGLKPGEKMRECQTCGHQEIETIEITHSHKLNQIPAKEPTALEPGWKPYSQCSICLRYFAGPKGEYEIGDEAGLKAWKSEGGGGYIKPTGLKPDHVCYNFIEEVKGKEATCKNDGHKNHYICKDCGIRYANADASGKIEDYDAWKKGEGRIPATGCIYVVQKDKEYHWKECKSCHTVEEKSKEPHTFGEWQITEPTEKSEGFKKRQCTLPECGQVETESIPKLEHEHKPDAVVRGKEPACKEPGWRSYYKCRCGKIFEDEGVVIEITSLDTWKKEEGKLNATGHKYGEWTLVTESTEETEGVKERICEQCNVEVQEKIPKLKHVHDIYKAEGKEPTEKEDGWKLFYQCECGKSFEDPEGKILIRDVEAWKAGSGKLPKTGKDEPGSGTTTPNNQQSNGSQTGTQSGVQNVGRPGVSGSTGGAAGGTVSGGVSSGGAAAGGTAGGTTGTSRPGFFTPQTGDGNHIMLRIVVTLVSLGIVVGIVVKKRKK